MEQPPEAMKIETNSGEEVVIQPHQEAETTAAVDAEGEQRFEFQKNAFEDFKATYAKQIATEREAAANDPEKLRKLDAALMRIWESMQAREVEEQLDEATRTFREYGDTQVLSFVEEALSEDGKPVDFETLKDTFLSVRHQEAIKEEQARNPNYATEKGLNASREIDEARLRGAGRMTGADWMTLAQQEALRENLERHREISRHFRVAKTLIVQQEVTRKKENADQAYMQNLIEVLGVTDKTGHATVKDTFEEEFVQEEKAA